MAYIICQSCGNGVVQTLDINICTRCIKLGSDRIKVLAIKKYLEKYPEAKAQEVSQNLGISGKIIDRFIKEGSLILVQNGEKIRVKGQEKNKEDIKKEQKRQNLIKQLSNMNNYSKTKVDKEERSKLLIDLEKRKKDREER